LDTDRLQEGIEKLRQRGGDALYPNAWHALTAEAERRRAGGPDQTVRIRRGDLNELPAAVRLLVDVRVGLAICTHCGKPNPLPEQFLEVKSNLPLMMACRHCEREFEAR
jgi:hypothetical protein